MQNPTSFLLVVKAGHAEAAATAGEMLSWLVKRGHEARVVPANTSPAALRADAEEVDAVIVLGGDGTVVGVCRKLAGMERPVPYIGVNFGQVGFLAEVPPDDWEPWLDCLLAGKLAARPRLTLAWMVRRDGQTVDEGFAVNDVVVGRGSLARVLPVRVVVEEPPQGDGDICPRSVASASPEAGYGEIHDLGWIRSDGILISTPQGTSAYALSAHGPLLHPDVVGLALTPISPFFKSFAPMVLPSGNVIRLETAGQGGAEVFLTVDGQEGVALSEGDVVTVRGVEAGFFQLTPKTDTYFRRLRERGFIQTPDGQSPTGTGPGDTSREVFL